MFDVEIGDEHSIPTEARLWRAILVQALQDIKSNTYDGRTRWEQRSAMLWIGSRDFYTVCDYAYLDPNFTLEKVKKYLNNETQILLKKPNGKGWRTQRKIAELRKLFEEKSK